MHLLIRVVEITGRCPVYKVGDSFRLEDGYRLISDIPLCMHALAALLPFYNALRFCEPGQLGLAGKTPTSNVLTLFHVPAAAQLFLKSAKLTSLRYNQPRIG